MPRKTPRTKPKRRTTSRAATQKGVPEIAWIKDLASPYLNGYRASATNRGPLRGYRFDAPARGKTKLSAGFFVGYLVAPDDHEFLKPTPPECIVFAFLAPAGSRMHREFVSRKGSLLRKTNEYIGWLTHRLPRFVFLDDQDVVLVRHFPMAGWPIPKREHFSRNFFIETLAWLVRSALVARLRDGAPAPTPATSL